MRITTWNVSGLRALLRKEGWGWVDKIEPDVFCLQEIKARQDQVAPLDLSITHSYDLHWHPAVKPGYSGVLTGVKKGEGLPEPGISIGLGIEQFDVEGRVIQTTWDRDNKRLVLYNLYVPNGGREQKKVPFKLDFYAELLAQCDERHARGEQIIICGDINTAHQEIDLKNPKSNQKTTGFLPEEREWITKYLEHGFVDIFRHLYPDREQYTYWDYVTKARDRNVGWRLDYFLISPGMVPFVKDVITHDDIFGSDHCPVTLEFDIPF